MIKKIDNNTKKGENKMTKKIDNNTKKGENNMIKKITVPILSATLLFGAGTLGASAMLNHTAPAAPISPAITVDQLSEAIKSNDPNIVQYMIASYIDNGGDVNAKDESGNTPLHLAVISGNTEFTQILLEKIPPENVPQVLGVKNKFGLSPLKLAVAGKDRNMVKLFSDKIVQMLGIQDDDIIINNNVTVSSLCANIVKSLRQAKQSQQRSHVDKDIVKVLI